MKKFLLDSALVLLIVSGFSIAPANAFTLHNYQTGLCLGVAAGNPNPGTAMVTWTCDGTPSQQWGQITTVLAGNGWQQTYVYSSSFTPSKFISNGPYGSPFYLSSGLATLTNVPANTGLTYIGATSTSVLGVKAGFMADGTALIEWGQTTDANQQWYALFVGNNFDGEACYAFENVSYWSFNGPVNGGWNYVMGVLGGKTNKGAPVVIWQQFLDTNGNPDYHQHPDQIWCVY